MISDLEAYLSESVEREKEATEAKGEAIMAQKNRDRAAAQGERR